MKREEMKLLKERHGALETDVALHRDRHTSGYAELMWERTLGELSGGEFDSVFGLRVFVARLISRSERQRFLDDAATRLCQIARQGSGGDLVSFARVAYDQAESLWRERQKRRNERVTDDEDIPF